MQMTEDKIYKPINDSDLARSQNNFVEDIKRIIGDQNIKFYDVYSLVL